MEEAVIASEKLYFFVDENNPHHLTFKVEYSGGKYDSNIFSHKLIGRCFEEAKKLIGAPRGTGQILEEPDPDLALTHALFELEFVSDIRFRTSTGYAGKKTDTGAQSLAVQLSNYIQDLVLGWGDLAREKEAKESVLLSQNPKQVSVWNEA